MIKKTIISFSVLAIALLVALFCMGCPPKPVPGTVIEIDQHIDRLLKGVPYTPHANGYWLSDDALDGLLQQLENLQRQIDAMPKVDSDTFRQNVPAEMGQSPDDSARLSGFMANNSDGDYYNPQPRYQAETVGRQELSSRALPVMRGAGSHDLDSHIGFPMGPN